MAAVILTVAAVLTGWTMIALLVAIVIGRAIRMADRGGPQGPTSVGSTHTDNDERR